MTESPSGLGVLMLECVVRAERDLHFRGHLGGAIRGAVGPRLREAGCLTGASLCTSAEGLCRSAGGCGYGIAYEVTRHRVSSGWFPQPMAPYVFRAPWDRSGVRRRAGDTLAYQLKLVGRARGHAHLFAAAMQRAWAGWIGAADHKGAHRLEAVYRLDGSGGRRLLSELGAEREVEPTVWLRPPAAEPSAALEEGWLRFLTPLSLKGNDRKPMERLDAVRMTGDFCRRVIHLSEFYERAPFELDWPRLRAEAAAVEVTEDRWMRYHRSARVRAADGEAVPIEGMYGSVRVTRVAGYLSSVWELMGWLHAGHGSSLGLGQAVWEADGRVGSLPGHRYGLREAASADGALLGER